MQVVNLTPIVGLPQFDGWSQVTIDPSKEFVCAFAVSGSNAGNVGRDLVDFLDSVKPNSAVELHQLFQHIIDQVNQKGCQLSVVAGVFIEQACYLGTYQASICLKRNEKVGQLVNSDQNIKIIEGQVKLGDVFVLVTDGGRSFLEEIQQKLGQGYDVDTIITSVVPSLHNSANSSLSAVAFGVIADRLYASDAEEKVIPPPDEVEETPILPLSAVENDLPNSDYQEIEEIEELKPDLELSNNSLPEETTPNMSAINAVPYDPVLSYPPPVVKKKSFNAAQIISAFKKIPVTNILKQSGSLIQKFLRLIKKWWIGLTSSDVYVNQPDKRKIARVAVLGLLILSLVIGVTGFYFYRRNQQQKQVTASLQPLEVKLTQAQALVNSDPIAARQQTEQSIMEMQTLADSLAKQKSSQKLVLARLEQAKQFYDSISGQEEFQELPTFYDLRLAKPNFIAAKVLFAAPNAYFLDPGLSEIVVLNTNNKEVTTISLNSEFAIKDMTLMGKNLYLLGNGLYKVKLGETEVAKVKDADEVTKEPGLIASFNDFIYVLSPSKKNIYRYDQTDGKFNEPKSWLKIQPDLDFAQISAWAIDGDVWLTNTDGRIYRFRTGKLNNFSLVGLPEDFGSTLMIFAQAESKNVYLLEAKKHRLVVLDKDGKFVKEIKSGSLASANNLIVDETNNKVFVVSGSLVFVVGI
jgi:hypothetical protein